MSDQTDLVEVNHEGWQSDRHTLQSPDPGKDAIRRSDHGWLGRHVATNVGHEHNDCYLQIAQVSQL